PLSILLSAVSSSALSCPVSIIIVERMGLTCVWNVEAEICCSSGAGSCLFFSPISSELFEFSELVVLVAGITMEVDIFIGNEEVGIVGKMLNGINVDGIGKKTRKIGIWAGVVPFVTFLEFSSAMPSTRIGAERGKGKQ